MENIEAIYFQEKNINYLKNIFGKELWVQISGHRDLNRADAGFWAALISLNNMDRVFEDFGWDCSVGTQEPGFLECEQGAIYERIHTDMDSCEHIVHYRDFHDLKPDYVELCEEFRLLNNLYHDKKTDIFYEVLDSGQSTEVAKIEKNVCAYVKLNYLIRYATAKQMALLLFFDIRTHIDGRLEELQLSSFSNEYKEDNLFFGIWGDEMNRTNDPYIYSVLMGKKIIYPKSIEECGYWPYEKQDECLDFIIGINDDGTPKSFTSDPDKLNNYFDSNPDAPQFLTPIFFKKEVLQKYLSHPEMYAVDDGCITCQRLWQMHIDNHQKEYVSVYLGDLGQALPREDQMHWKNHNILIDGKLSAVKFKRDFLNMFTDAEISDLKFKIYFLDFKRSGKRLKGGISSCPLKKTMSIILSNYIFQS